MRKLNQTLLIIGVLCMAIPSFAQTTLVQWPLDNANGISATNYATYIDPASDFTRGNGIGVINTSGGDGASARGWYPDTIIGVVDYYEVCFTPKSGVFLEIDALKFDESRTVGGPKTYEVHWSIDGFITSKQIDSTVIAENDISTRSRNLSGIGLSLCDGQQLCFRLYGYNASDPNGTWKIEDNTFLIEGNIPSTCTPPANQAPTLMLNATTSSMDISMQDGGGNARLIVIKEGGPVTGIPCSGNAYTADVIFGMGQQLGNGEYTVYAGPSTGPSLTAVTVTGLSEGKTYYVAVFEYYNNNLCYLQTNPKTGVVVTSCNLPDEVITPLSSIANEEILFSWSAPYCYDDVLIVVGLDSVMGVPTGNGSNYTPNTIYGSGSDTGGDFTGDEYPVYLGNGSAVTITGLMANTNYFLKVFTRLGTDWSNGVDILISTATGCTSLNNDVVFINELHYQNYGVDEDEGVEIAGPAGVNLAAYEIHFYKKTTNTTCEYYKTVALSGIIDNEDGTYGAVWFPIADIEDQSGAVAIYNTLTATLVQFLSYRNSNFTAIDGIANGEMAEPMNHTVNGSGAAAEVKDPSQVGQSLQLVGFGPCPSNSTHYWAVAAETMGKFNVNQALPVELISFTARKVEKEVLLQWQTATELDNDYFIVEHSRNGRDFTAIGNVQGAGTTFEIQQYDLKDKSPFEGNNYYRLRQVDFNGQNTLSKVIVIKFQSNNQKEIAVYPTMTSSYLNVTFSPIRGEDAQLEIIDLNGRIVLMKALKRGSKSYILQTNELNKGHYILRIQQNEYSNIARFVKM